MIEPLRCVCCFLFACFALSVQLAAQTNVTGQVVTADSTPAPGIRVVLHRVGSDVQGPVDSIVSDKRGGFRFHLSADTSAIYIVSGRYAGIEYFSLPISARMKPGQISVVVYDTSSTAPVELAARHVVVTRPDQDGSRGVLDLLVLENRGRKTRVARDPLHPSWTGPLPSGSVGLEVGESDVSSRAVERRGDSLVVTAALSPGEKQVTVEYQVRADRKTLELPVERKGLSLNVLAEEPDVRVQGSDLALRDTQMIQGRAFRRWSGTIQSPGTIRIILPRVLYPPKWILLSLVGALALVLVLSGGYLVSRGRGSPVPASEELITAIAALDLRYEGREQEVPTEEWSTYRSERARLKTELQASLAAEERTR